MRIAKLLGTVGAAALLAAAVAMPANSAEMANTQLKDTSGKPVGDVDLMQTPSGVLIKLQIKGLTPEQISSALRRHLDLSQVSIVKAGDF